MSGLTRAEAEAIVDGFTFVCEPQSLEMLSKPELLQNVTMIQDQMNAMLKAQRQGFIDALLKPQDPAEVIGAHWEDERVGNGTPIFAKPTGRVKWIHDCGQVSADCGYDRGGTVWEPDRTWVTEGGLEGKSLWATAMFMGLTADPAPEPGRPYSMVSWDCRPGALQVHYDDELRPE